MKVISVNIGQPTKIQWNHKIIETGIFKTPITHPILLGKEHVQNDTVADRNVHGGIDKAVYAFGKNHYPFYRAVYPNLPWENGMFGENLTLDHLDETNIYVGDIYQLGESIIQVSKPRQPCFKLGIRFKNQSVLKTMWNSNKTGVYFKVIQPGLVAIDDSLVCISTDRNRQSIADVFLSKQRNK